MMRTANPTLSAKTFAGVTAGAGQAMTIQGTANKTGILLCLVLLTSSWVWGGAFATGTFTIAVGAGAIGGFIWNVDGTMRMM